jgi:carbamoyl-phosphate synthase small subunit
MKECLDFPSNWRSEHNLVQYLKENKIVSIENLDTRALTKHLRDNGVQMGIISTEDLNPESLLQKVKRHPGISSVDLVKDVTTDTSFAWTQNLWKLPSASPELESTNPPLPPFSKGGTGGISIVVFDFGIKFNILRHLAETGFNVTVVPAGTPAEEAVERADGIVLSNGPGDPRTVTYAVETAKKLIGKKPILGICLGHQILGLALGGSTYKLKFGHHGGNHPVMDLATEKVEITSQNHNYCVDVENLKGQVELTHRNLYDGTEEGLKHKDFPILSIQYHPEAGPGPNDARYIFTRFKDMVDTW